MARELPVWAREMREIFRSGTTSQFVIHGNIYDLVPSPDAKGAVEYLGLQRFLTETMFAQFDVVIWYDRGKGIRVRKGGDAFHRFLKAFDTFQGTSWAALPDSGADKVASLDLGNLLPRDPKSALELIDRFIRGAIGRTRVVDGKPVPDPLKVGVIIDYAHFIAPQGEPLYLSDLSQTLIQLLDWATNPMFTDTYACIATVLTCENLADLNRTLVENPYAGRVKIELPTVAELKEFVADITADYKDFESLCEVSREILAEKLVGLSRVNVRNLIRRAFSAKEMITLKYLTDVKKDLIEKEAFGKLEFLETDRTLDDVAGHQAAKAWLRQDAVLLKRGVLRAIPMGYLLTGRIGTGKTFLVECLAGEIGVPCVEMKNFREKWVGATEGNLEKVFSILHALGQVIVFVDEADQAMGKRSGGDSDSGLSGRIYAMMAKEMSDTRNRGKIIWIFATSRPDLLEVDLKRQGRLDVHIPLFPPTDPEGRRDLFGAMAKKLKMPITRDELPELPDTDQIGGNEMEGILVRALRDYETALDAAAQPGAPGTPAQPGAPGTPTQSGAGTALAADHPGGPAPSAQSGVGAALAAAQAGAPPTPDQAPDGRGQAPPLRLFVERVIADVRPSAHTERLELMDLVAVKECTDTRFLPERYRTTPIAEVNQRLERLKLNLGE